MTDWTDKAAEGIIVLGGIGALVGYAWREEDGMWEKRQVPAPGKLGPPTNDREQLTPDELLEALRGPLRG